MKLIIISGRSGSGKSTCLHILEDINYYCVDNLPASLLETLVERIQQPGQSDFRDIAVGIDARNISSDLSSFTSLYQTLKEQCEEVQIIYLDADDSTLLKRFSETRRKHPLSNYSTSLIEAIQKEQALLSPISSLANLNIDTSDLSLHQLRDTVKTRVAEHGGPGTALLFQSFGFKNRLPSNADMVFDARCIPNPHWVPSLRSLTGLDSAVIDFLDNQPEAQEFYSDIQSFLKKWIPRFESNNRSYLTVAVGCTGGQHRSVYLCEKLKQYFSQSVANIQVRHKELT